MKAADFNSNKTQFGRLETISTKILSLKTVLLSRFIQLALIICMLRHVNRPPWMALLFETNKESKYDIQSS